MAHDVRFELQKCANAGKAQRIRSRWAATVVGRGSVASVWLPMAAMFCAVVVGMSRASHYVRLRIISSENTEDRTMHPSRPNSSSDDSISFAKQARSVYIISTNLGSLHRT